MRSTVISTHVPQLVAKRLIKKARERGVSVSRQAADILERYCKDVPLLTEGDLDSAEQSISGTYESFGDLMRHVDEVATDSKNDTSF
jgi:integrase